MSAPVVPPVLGIGTCRVRVAWTDPAIVLQEFQLDGELNPDELHHVAWHFSLSLISLRFARQCKGHTTEDKSQRPIDPDSSHHYACSKQ